jgi:hypothetical protein
MLDRLSSLQVETPLEQLTSLLLSWEVDSMRYPSLNPLFSAVQAVHEVGWQN